MNTNQLTTSLTINGLITTKLHCKSLRFYEVDESGYWLLEHAAENQSQVS